MLLTELIDWVMVQSGEFIVEELDNTLIDKNRFWILVKKDLRYYSKYYPRTKKFSANVDGSKTFLDPDIPKFISKCTPIGSSLESSSSGFSVLVTPKDVFSVTNSFKYPKSGNKFWWEYESPSLYVSKSGMVSITAHYDYETEITTDVDGKVEEVDIKLLEDDDDFYDLVLSSFLVALGRSRRAFTLNDLPITMDAGDLVSEGRERRDQVVENIQNNHLWYLGIKT